MNIRPGSKIGKWTIGTFAGTFVKEGTTKAEPYWNAECECGTKRQVAEGNLLSLGSLSCGCRLSEMLVKRNTTHGLSKTKLPLVRCFRSIHERCENPKHCKYRRYGGRGIKVCNRWSKIEHFIEDMEPTWERGLSIHRIDNDGDYTPENCIWADRFTQANVTCLNKKLTIVGITKTLAEWVRFKKVVSYNTALARIIKGWEPETAFSTPTGEGRHFPKNSQRMITFDGKTMPLSAWAREVKMPYHKLRSRLRMGWSFDEAIKP